MTTEVPNNPSDWPTDPAAYSLIGKIGQGAFASVWRATATVSAPTAASAAVSADNDASHVADHNNNNNSTLCTTRDCAVKVLNLDHVDTNLSEIRLEVQAMRLSSHPNVLTCHTAFVKDTNLWLVTQLMRKGSSLHCLQTARRRRRRENKQQQQQQQQDTNVPNTIPMEPHIMYILHETLLGLQYIHDNGQIHRDVKSSNILIDADASVRIADFGVSGWLVQGGSQQEKAKTFVGTPCWMAPEVMEQIHGYDTKADVWSLGITAMELAKGYAPYAKYPPMKVLILTIQEDPPSLETYDMNDDDSANSMMEEGEQAWSKSFQQMIAWCLQKNPAKRPTCQELLQSKFFSAFHKEDYRAMRQAALRTEICDLVDDVGTKQQQEQQEPSSSLRQSLPGTVPVSIVSSMGENRPAGTTWIFADGSQVLASSTKGSVLDDEEVFDELDAFGENYARDSDGAANKTVKTASTPYKGKDDADDLDDFMDEFEQTTGGENFRGAKS